MFLAKELNKSLEEVLELSVLEFRMWVAYYKIERHKREEAQKKNAIRKR